MNGGGRAKRERGRIARGDGEVDERAAGAVTCGEEGRVVAQQRRAQGDAALRVAQEELPALALAEAFPHHGLGHLADGLVDFARPGGRGF